MGDQYVGFGAHFLPNQTLPPGYEVEGVFGECFDGAERTLYYWYLCDADGVPTTFGSDLPDRFAARREAWAHYRDTRNPPQSQPTS